MLNEYYKEVKNILEETTVIDRTEQGEFLTEAEKYFADLEKQQYTVLIAGKTSNCFRCLLPKQPRTIFVPG